jgi:hypothetical protein
VGAARLSPAAAGDYRNDVERINLERTLVGMLGDGCERVVVGYTLRREDFNADYSNGVEDVGFDSQAGLLSAISRAASRSRTFRGTAGCESAWRASLRRRGIRSADSMMTSAGCSG